MSATGNGATMRENSLTIFDEATIQEAVRLLLTAAPGSTVILFGSYARGNPTVNSDLDFLVVEPEAPRSQFDEMVRLREVLRPLRVCADVLVTDRRTFQRRSKAPGTVHYWAAREGRVFNAVA